MPYAVKEIYYTLQGEGAHTGRPAIFCRFAGCNLWSGREADRPHAVCQFCDTDFVGVNGPGGGKFTTAGQLADAVLQHWEESEAAAGNTPFVVCTGGEPLLQLDTELIDAFHQRGFSIAIETNGTLMPPSGIDWVCVSPKAGAVCVLKTGDELKLVYPQGDLSPGMFTAWDFDRFFLQPMDGPDRDQNTLLAEQYCKQHPQWELSLQMHKLTGMR